MSVLSSGWQLPPSSYFHDSFLSLTLITIINNHAQWELFLSRIKGLNASITDRGCWRLKSGFLMWKEEYKRPEIWNMPTQIREVIYHLVTVTQNYAKVI